jgi:hypothetical protein
MLKVLEAKCLLYKVLLEKEVEFLSDNKFSLNKFKDEGR